MKKILLLCSLLACSLGVSYAQTTAVTATVVDSDGTTWANGKWSIAWTPGPSNPNINAYTNNGAKLSNSVAYQSGTLNGSGALSVTVYDSSVTFPTGSGWALSVCSNTSAPCSTYNFSTAGGSQDISAALTTNIAAPRFKAVSGTYGYADTEATLSIATGATYWNVTSGLSRCYSGSAWGACSPGGSNATTINGGSIPPSAPCLGSNGGSQLITAACAVQAGWIDPVTSNSAAGIATTTTGTLTGGTSSLAVTSATGWTTGMGIAIAGAGSGSVVSAISITAPGSYTACPTALSFTGGGGSGATGVPICYYSNGIYTVVGATFTGGSGFSSAPAIGFTGGSGAGGATATSSVVSECITTVDVIVGTTFTLHATCPTSVAGATINHDDTAALSTAITSASTSPTGGVYLRPGIYNVTSTLTINTPINFTGNSGTIIQNRGTTNDVILVNYLSSTASEVLGTTIGGFAINQASGIVPSAGYALHFGRGVGGTFTSQIYTLPIMINSTFAGVYFDSGLFGNRFNSLSSANNISGWGAVYNTAVPGGDNHVNDFHAIASNVYIPQSDTNSGWVNLKINTGTLILGSSAERINFSNTSIEQSPVCAIDATLANANTYSIFFSGLEYEATNLFCSPSGGTTPEQWIGYTGVTNGRSNTVSSTLNTVSKSNVPADIICAQAGDTTIQSLAYTSGTIVGGVATLTFPNLNSANHTYVIIGQKFGITGFTGTAVLGAGPYVVTGSNNSTTISFATAAVGTITGGSVYRWCSNQVVDGSTQTMFANSYLTLGGPLNPGPTIDYRTMFNFTSSSAPPKITLLMFETGGSSFTIPQFTPQASLISVPGEIGMDMVNIQPGGTPASWAQSMKFMWVPSNAALPFTSVTTSPNNPNFQWQWFITYAATAVASINSSTGGTITGNIGETCTLATFNNSCAGSTATGTLTAPNTLAGATWVINTRGQSCTAAPTTATIGAGSAATCTGTATLTTTLGGATGNATDLVSFTNRP